MNKTSITLRDQPFQHFMSWCYVPISESGPYFIICCIDIMFVYVDRPMIKYVNTNLVIYDISYISADVCKNIIKKDDDLFKYGGLIVFDNYKPSVSLYSIDMKHKKFLYCDSSREYLCMSMRDCKV